MPQYFTKLQFKKMIAPKNSKTTVISVIFVIMQVLLTLLLLGLLLNFMITSVKPYKVEVLNLTSTETRISDSSYKFPYTTDTLINLKPKLRVHHAIYGYTTDWVDFSLIIDPTNPSLTPPAGTPPGLTLTYNIYVQTKSFWPQSCNLTTVNCSIQATSVTQTSNVAGTNEIIVQFATQDGEFILSEISIIVLILICILVVSTSIVACNRMRWEVIAYVARTDAKVRRIE
ncbi:Hypothetical_protein [Hexamita inflata]|uniref:Hypothetical_protein n=1 Tax=Hexamita inflata TaxID=28002 RepID=A0ABP1IKQ1_9EUKA